jgi:hypothetical protein
LLGAALKLLAQVGNVFPAPVQFSLTDRFQPRKIGFSHGQTGTPDVPRQAAYG